MSDETEAVVPEEDPEEGPNDHELTPDEEESNRMEQEVCTLQKSLRFHRAEAVKAQEKHAAEVSVLKDRINDLVKGQNTRVKKTVEASRESWTAAITQRVKNLPASWAPGMVARKIEDPEFVHPGGIAEFAARVDENGNVVRFDGALVPA